MTRLHKNTNGFSAIEALLVILTLTTIGVAGYFVAVHVDKKQTPATTTAITPSSAVPLIITRSNPLNQPNVPNFTVDISNVTTASMLYSDIQHLQTMPGGTTSCPNDNGVMYKLVFANPKVTANVDVSGCEHVTLSNTKTTYTANTTDTSGKMFFSDLSKATGKSID